jgi:CSLREA domain-containing protein
MHAPLRVALVAGLLIPLLAGCGPGPGFTVNDPGDAADAAPGNGTCATVAGNCTLRAAIQEANARSGANTVRFALSGSGVRTIQLSSSLPPLNDRTGATTIDGYTQAGSSPNGAADIDDAVLRVQIRGTGPDGVDGIRITSPGNLVRGLALFNIRRPITLQGPDANRNRVVGNFLGTDAAGVAGVTTLEDFASGVVINTGASDNLIGGPARADRNVISGNGRDGVDIFDQGTSGNIVQGNIVGLSPRGDRKLGNSIGIDANTGAAGNVFGGTGPGERNVVSGNRGAGVELSHETIDNRVIGNFVGTDVAGRLVANHTVNGNFDIQLQDGVRGNVVASNVIGGGRTGAIQVRDPGTTGNVIRDNSIGATPQDQRIPNGIATTGGWGIYVYSGATGNTIGPGNIIAFSRNAGIAMNDNATDRNTITANRIHDNAGLGINISPLAGVNANDAGDADAGANQQLNFPVITSARRSAVAGTACGGCRVEVFEAAADPSGYGEGRVFRGATTAAGGGAFTVGSLSLAEGVRVTATATDGQGNTSEFAQNKIVAGA